jgi:hypothetical protein
LAFVRSDSDTDPTGNIYAYLAAGCGQLRCPPVWTAPAGGDSHSSPAVSGGMVFVAGNDAILHAYGLD